VHAAAYAAAKAGLCRLADQLQAELLDTGLRVNAIEPGTVPAGDPAAARPAAALVAFLASRQGEGIRGRVIAASDTWWQDPDTVRRIGKSVLAYRLRRFEAD
jgi:NAD(P)-dependent dehydrogenase (short-subunit alcohol dehydrogenase family)